MSSTLLTNWTVYYADDAAAGAGMKQIKWTGITGTNSVNELYSALMDLFDNTAQNDYFDSIPIKAITPTLYEIGASDAGDRQPWFIDPDSVHHLTGAGLNSSKWSRDLTARTASHGIYKLTRSTSNIVVGDIGRTFTTSGTATGWILHVSGTAIWVRPNDGTATHDLGAITSITAGGHTDTITARVTNDSMWSNIYTLGTLESGTQLYVYQNASAISPWWSTDHIDILMLTTDFGSLIDSGNLSIFARQYTKLYDHYIADVSTGGRTPIPLATSPDVNNTTASGTVSGYSISISSFGTYTHDVDADGSTENYDVEINCNGLTLKQMYEYLKYVTRGGSTTSINGVNGEVYQAAQASYLPIKTAPFGTFAGGKFFGARGVYVYGMAAGDANNYQLFDAGNIQRIPPQSIALAVNGLVAGDQVGVFRATGDNNTINKSMFTIYDAHTNSVDSEIRVNGSIPSDTPTAGSIRVVYRNAAGDIQGEDKYTYVSFTNGSPSTFNLSGTINQNITTDGTVYVPYIDTDSTDGSPVSVTLIYTADRYLTARVRQSGYLPFMSKYQLTNANLSITAVRATDSIA